MPTLVSARLRTTLTLSDGTPISPSVSRPSRVFFSDGASSIPTMQIGGRESIVAITSGVKPGGVSTTMKSNAERSTG